MASGRFYLDLSLKAFESGDYEAAERFAVMSMNGFRFQFPLPTEILSQLRVYVQACQIHVAHAKKKTPCGGTDWYAVLGVDYSVSMDEVLHRSIELCTMLDLRLPGIHAFERAQNLVDQARKNIMRDIKKRILEANLRERSIEIMAEMEGLLRECTDCENATPAESSGSKSVPPTYLANGWRAVRIKRQYAEAVGSNDEDRGAKRIRTL